MDRLKAELMYERRTSEEQLSRFEDERRVWQEEKEKVQQSDDFVLLLKPSEHFLSFTFYSFPSLTVGNLLPETAAAELHPDVPSKPGSGACDEGA